MNPNQPVVEPNFEGEEMKIPVDMAPVDESTANQSLINTPILILLFAILVALLGGIYYWYTIVMSTPIAPAPTRPTAEMNNEPESATAEARTATTDVVSTSDDLEVIGADVESLNLDDIDTNMQAVETELEAATQAQ